MEFVDNVWTHMDEKLPSCHFWYVKKLVFWSVAEMPGRPWTAAFHLSIERKRGRRTEAGQEA